MLAIKKLIGENFLIYIRSVGVLEKPRISVVDPE
jgi:hypothetical protein